MALNFEIDNRLGNYVCREFMRDTDTEGHLCDPAYLLVRNSSDSEAEPTEEDDDSEARER